MKKEDVKRLFQEFEEYAELMEGIECWFARDLQKLLGYSQWRNFSNVIEKAKISCENSDHPINDHFADVSKTIPMPKGATKEIDDIILTRYACYLIAQNGDPKKEEIAFAQTYFAIQTRKQELLEDRIELIERLQAREKLRATETELSEIIYERDVDDKGFGRIRSKGDAALFGGYSTMQMKKKIGMPKYRPLADFLPTITIKAKDLATEITNFNVKKDSSLTGEPKITTEHVKNNTDVRNLLGKSGIKPEELPPEEDIKKLERKVKSDEKKFMKGAKKFKIPNSPKNI
ncbi:MAG: DNA damage-inducible protein D [Desulfobacterales bacterium]|nr:DNA damage-inducible protein D [Desulfobacterales bacterium]